MRKSRFPVIFALAATGLCALRACAQNQSHPQNPLEQRRLELNTVLMQCTFEIEGRNTDGQVLIGTSFVMGRPIPKVPGRGKYVLITAAHVLDGIAGDVAILHLRRNRGYDWVSAPIPVHIRANGHPLWIRHPQADVAVMYILLPADLSLPLLTTDLLADDTLLSRYEIHPGDVLECLGYPLGLASNDAGFPILRSGRIASYPLLPTAANKTFLFDFRVFKGNSGGPVYFVEADRIYGNAVHLGETIGFIAGLVSEEKVLPLPISGPYEQGLREVQLSLAVVVDASLIKQAIEMLPPP